MIGHRAVLSFLSLAFPLWSSETPISILNVCGSRKLTTKIQVWAKKKNAKVSVVETDNLREPKFLQAQQFDYVVSDGVLNGRSDEEVQFILVAANRLARRGLAFSDYLRDPRAAIWMMLGAFLLGRSMVSARLAVQGGFTVSEVQSAAEKAGLKFASIRKHFGYRFCLAGERGLIFSKEAEPIPGFAGA